MAVSANKMTQRGQEAKSGRDRVDSFKLEDGDEFIIYLCPDNPDFQMSELTDGQCHLEVDQWVTAYNPGGGHEWQIQFPAVSLSDDANGNRELFEHPVMLERLAEKDFIPTDRQGNVDVDAIMEFDPIADLKIGTKLYEGLNIPFADLKGLRRQKGYIFGVVALGRVEVARSGVSTHVMFEESECFPQRWYPSANVFKQVAKAFEDAKCDITNPDKAMLLKVSRENTNKKITYDVSLYVPTIQNPMVIPDRLWSLIETEQEPGGTLDLFGAIAAGVKPPDVLQAEILEAYKPKGKGGNGRGATPRDQMRNARSSTPEPETSRRTRAAALPQEEEPQTSRRRQVEEPAAQASRRAPPADEPTTSRRTRAAEPPPEPEPEPEVQAVRTRRAPAPVEDAPVTANRRAAAPAAEEPASPRRGRTPTPPPEDDVPPFDDGDEGDPEYQADEDKTTSLAADDDAPATPPRRGGAGVSSSRMSETPSRRSSADLDEAAAADFEKQLRARKAK